MPEPSSILEFSTSRNSAPAGLGVGQFGGGTGTLQSVWRLRFLRRRELQLPRKSCDSAVSQNCHSERSRPTFSSIRKANVGLRSRGISPKADVVVSRQIHSWCALRQVAESTGPLAEERAQIKIRPNYD